MTGGHSSANALDGATCYFPVYEVLLALVTLSIDGRVIDIEFVKSLNAALQKYRDASECSAYKQQDTTLSLLWITNALDMELCDIVPFLVLPPPMSVLSSASFSSPLTLPVAVAAKLALFIASHALEPCTVAAHSAPLALLAAVISFGRDCTIPALEVGAPQSHFSACVTAKALHHALYISKDFISSAAFIDSRILGNLVNLLPEHSAGLRALAAALRRKDFLSPASIAKAIPPLLPLPLPSSHVSGVGGCLALAASVQVIDCSSAIPGNTISGSVARAVTCPGCHVTTSSLSEPFHVLSLDLPLDSDFVPPACTTKCAAASTSAAASVWTCVTCTFINDASNSSCDMCKKPRAQINAAVVSKHALVDLLDFHFREERIDSYACPQHCIGLNSVSLKTTLQDRARSQLQLASLPLVFIVDIKRFFCDKRSESADGKRSRDAAVGLLRPDLIEFGAELNLGQYTSHHTPAIYDLQAVTFLLGSSAERGHYVAGARGLHNDDAGATQGWGMYDDYKREPSSFEEMCSAVPNRHVKQLFFFRRANLDKPESVAAVESATRVEVIDLCAESFSVDCAASVPHRDDLSNSSPESSQKRGIIDLSDDSDNS